MAVTIWKYPLFTVDAQEVQIPRHSVPLAVQVQGDFPTMWARVDTAEPLVTMRVRTYGTGHEIDEPWLIYLGTYQLHDGALVMHVFYRPALLTTSTEDDTRHERRHTELPGLDIVGVRERGSPHDR